MDLKAFVISANAWCKLEILAASRFHDDNHFSVRKTTISDYLKHLAAFMLQVHNTDPDHVSALRFVFALNRALMSFIDMLHVYKKQR